MKSDLPLSPCHHFWSSRMQQVQDLLVLLLCKSILSTPWTDNSTEIEHDHIPQVNYWPCSASQILKKFKTLATTDRNINRQWQAVCRDYTSSWMGSEVWVGASFQKISHFLGRLVSGPHLVRVRSSLRVSASFHIFPKGWYTLETKSNLTRSTLLKVNIVACVYGAKVTRSTKLKGRSTGNKNHSLSTKSAGWNMFNSGDNVDCEPATVDFRQNGDKSVTKLKVNNFVFRLCWLCVPAQSWTYSSRSTMLTVGGFLSPECQTSLRLCRQCVRGKGQYLQSVYLVDSCQAHQILLHIC